MTNPYRAHITVEIDFDCAPCNPEQYADTMTRLLQEMLLRNFPTHPSVVILDDITEPEDTP